MTGRETKTAPKTAQEEQTRSAPGREAAARELRIEALEARATPIIAVLIG